MPVYRAKLDYIKAVQLLSENEEEMLQFLDESKVGYDIPNMIDDSLTLVLMSLNGDQICHEGDYVMYNSLGEILIVEKEVFEATYELDDIPTLEKVETLPMSDDDTTTPDPEPPSTEPETSFETPVVPTPETETEQDFNAPPPPLQPMTEPDTVRETVRETVEETVEQHKEQEDDDSA